MYLACGMHSSLNRQILVFIVYHQHSPRRKLSTLSPKTYHSAHRVFYFNFSLTVNALQVSCHATSVYQLSHWQPLFCFPFLLPGRYRDLRRNISLRLVRQRAADCEREHFITEHQPHTMLCHVRGASDNVQQLFYKLAQTISFFFSLRYLWDLRIVPLQLSLVRYDEALLMRLATRFFSTIQEQWRTPNDPPTPWSEGWPFSNFSSLYQYILKRKDD